jgi:uncharacterized protein (DUF2236 family)
VPLCTLIVDCGSLLHFSVLPQLWYESRAFKAPRFSRRRAHSRLECGLTTELHPPDIETRMAILRKKAEALHIELAEDVLVFLAQRVRTNVRRPAPGGDVSGSAPHQSLLA